MLIIQPPAALSTNRESSQKAKKSVNFLPFSFLPARLVGGMNRGLNLNSPPFRQLMNANLCNRVVSGV